MDIRLSPFWWLKTVRQSGTHFSVGPIGPDFPFSGIGIPTGCDQLPERLSYPRNSKWLMDYPGWIALRSTNIAIEHGHCRFTNDGDFPSFFECFPEGANRISLGCAGQVCACAGGGGTLGADPKGPARWDDLTLGNHGQIFAKSDWRATYGDGDGMGENLGFSWIFHIFLGGWRSRNLSHGHSWEAPKHLWFDLWWHTNVWVLPCLTYLLFALY